MMVMVCRRLFAGAFCTSERKSCDSGVGTAVGPGGSMAVFFPTSQRHAACELGCMPRQVTVLWYSPMRTDLL